MQPTGSCITRRKSQNRLTLICDLLTIEVSIEFTDTGPFGVPQIGFTP